MAEFFKTTRGKIAVLVPLTGLLLVLMIAFELPVAIMPALMIPIWLPFFTEREESLSLSAQRRMRVAIAVGVAVLLLTFVLGVALFAAPVLAGLVAGLVGVVAVLAVLAVLGAARWQASREA